jgi:hypothetical protein
MSRHCLVSQTNTTLAASTQNNRFIWTSWQWNVFLCIGANEKECCHGWFFHWSLQSRLVAVMVERLRRLRRSVQVPGRQKCRRRTFAFAALISYWFLLRKVQVVVSSKECFGFLVRAFKLRTVRGKLVGPWSDTVLLRASGRARGTVLRRHERKAVLQFIAMS